MPMLLGFLTFLALTMKICGDSSEARTMTLLACGDAWRIGYLIFVRKTTHLWLHRSKHLWTEKKSSPHPEPMPDNPCLLLDSFGLEVCSCLLLFFSKPRLCGCLKAQISVTFSLTCQLKRWSIIKLKDRRSLGTKNICVDPFALYLLYESNSFKNNRKELGNFEMFETFRPSRPQSAPIQRPREGFSDDLDHFDQPFHGEHQQIWSRKRSTEHGLLDSQKHFN